jgi:PhzF family phenazine biosynthesis protein
LIAVAAPTAQSLEVVFATDSSVFDGRWIDNGPGWCAVLLDSVERVLALTPDFAALGDLKLGVAALYPPDGASQLEVRAFVPSLSVPEDPVTGSLNAGLALWLIGEGLLPPRYVASQGAAVGRAGRVTVSAEADGTWIGGRAVIVLEGTAALD